MRVRLTRARGPQPTEGEACDDRSVNDSRLVAEDDGAPSTELVVVFRSTDPLEAGLVASALQDAGMMPLLRQDLPGGLSLPPVLTEPIVGQPTAVWLPKGDLAEAVALIRGMPGHRRPAYAIPAGSGPILGAGARPNDKARALAWVLLTGLCGVLVLRLGQALVQLFRRP